LISKAQALSPCVERILLLAQTIEKHESLYLTGTALTFEKQFSQILNLLILKYPSKIIYSISELGFTSYYELMTKINLGNGTKVRKFIFDLEELGIIKEVGKDSENYKVICNFWMREHPTCCKIPILFCLSNSFAPLISEFNPFISKKYFSKRELGFIHSKRKRFEQFLARIKNQEGALNIRDSDVAGKCVLCGSIARKSRGFKEYPIGIVCLKCDGAASKITIKKWLEQKQHRK